ncbi:MULTISPECIES: hypothetical protein [Paenibacillus]|uniref:hypothetical protein n=1 Tax=Paenibacillus TaxID=44249 RepID=UPI00096D9A73|nr:hypothetical protein [Paenibacillus odorifer]OMD18506.1 hypothetical protein BJP50_14350 [Paenibacillus odorifer]
MALLEYVAAKLVKKNSTRGTKSIMNEVIGLIKALVLGILKWALWVFNQLVPKWVRIALFFIVLYFLYFSYQQFSGHDGFPQMMDDLMNIFFH